MKERIKSEIAFAIILACEELINSFNEKVDDIYTNLIITQIKAALGQTTRKMVINLNQEHLNQLGEILTLNKKP